MPKDRSCPFQRENPNYKEGPFPAAIFNILLIVLKEKEHENWKPLHTIHFSSIPCGSI